MTTTETAVITKSMPILEQVIRLFARTPIITEAILEQGLSGNHLLIDNRSLTVKATTMPWGWELHIVRRD